MATVGLGDGGTGEGVVGDVVTAGVLGADAQPASSNDTKPVRQRRGRPCFGDVPESVEGGMVVSAVLVLSGVRMVAGRD